MFCFVFLLLVCFVFDIFSHHACFLHVLLVAWCMRVNYVVFLFVIIPVLPGALYGFCFPKLIVVVNLNLWFDVDHFIRFSSVLTFCQNTL